MRHIAVVGSGIAGDEAAHAARRVDSDARIVMITEESHPHYSACVLADYVADAIPRDRVFLRDPASYTRAGIELLMSQRVLDWSPEMSVLHLKDADVHYDSVIFATGSRPLVPPLPGVEKNGVFAFKTLQDADGIKTVKGRNAVVVGSGPVGIKAVLALRRKGWNVWMVELLDRILPRVFDAPMAALAGNVLKAQGIHICLEEQILEILGRKDVEGVRTDRRTLKADLVVMVVGMKPETALFEKGDLPLGALGGIQVDEFLNTGVSGAWACGDCVETSDLLSGRTGLYMLWHNARMQGRVAGANAAGRPRPYKGSLNITTVNLGDSAAASVGLIGADLEDDACRVFHRSGHNTGIFLVLRNDNLVGVQVVGRTERVGSLVGLMHRGGLLCKGPVERRPQASMMESWALREVVRDLQKFL